MKKYRGFMLLVVALVFTIAETIYFGCNTKPLTPAETICDGLGTIILFAGFFIGGFDWIDYFWSHVTITKSVEDE